MVYYNVYRIRHTVTYEDNNIIYLFKEAKILVLSFNKLNCDKLIKHIIQFY